MFWRGTVLPLANRIGSSLAHWLASAFGESVKLVADADSAPALAKDRAAAWEQVGKASFLTVNEKRVAIGYSPVEGGDGLGPGEVKFDLNQPRVPAGNPDGGQWTSGGEDNTGLNDPRVISDASPDNRVSRIP